MPKSLITIPKRPRDHHPEIGDHDPETGDHDEPLPAIFKRHDGRWAAVLNVGWRDGKRHRKYFYGATRDAVQKELTAALRAQHQGLPVAPERHTVKQFLNAWLNDCVRQSVRPRTFVSYSQLVKVHIVPDLGHIILSKLSPQDLQAFLNAKLKARRGNLSKRIPKNSDAKPAEQKKPETLSPRTVQYLYAVLRRALGQALKWGLVARNVATLVNPPSVRRPEVQPLTPDEARQLLDAIDGDRMAALYSVALALGVRQGEALGLRWEDVDLEAATLTIRKAMQRVHGKLELVDPKTTKSRRTVALPHVAVDALRAHRVRQLEERLLAGSRWHDEGLVFSTTIGTPLDGRNVTRHFQKLLLGAGLPRQRFHDLRHTCASLLLAQGVHPRVVMETLGHSQIKLTMDTYSHVIPQLQREAAGQMDALLSRAR